MLNKIRTLLLRPVFAQKQDVSDKKVIVTGASIGSLGYASAKTFLEWGADVVVTSRSHSYRIVDELVSELGSEYQKHIQAHDLDISNSESVQSFADWYINQESKLDILVNNAGIHLDLLSKWTEPKLSEDGYELQWRTNYLGTLHLTHLLFPLLTDTGSETRLINVVSMLHDKGSNHEFFNPSKPYNSWEAYGQSKLASMHFAFEAQRQFSDQKLKTFCLHPGAVYTNVAGKGLTGNPLVEKIRNTFAPLEKFFLKTPEEGAQTTIYCATSPNAIGGHYYRECKVAPPSKDAFDKEVSRKLWQAGEAWLESL